MNRWVYNISLLLGVAFMSLGAGLLVGVPVAWFTSIAAGVGAGLGAAFGTAGTLLIGLSIFGARLATRQDAQG